MRPFSFVALAIALGVGAAEREPLGCKFLAHEASLALSVLLTRPLPLLNLILMGITRAFRRQLLTWKVHQ